MADQKLLLGPGPSPCPEEVLTALSQPVLSHLDPEFLAVLDEVSMRLKDLFHLSSGLVIPLSGTGSMGMEATVANFVKEGMRAVVAVNGEFGRRIAEMLRRYGAAVEEVRFAWGSPIDAQEVAKKAREVSAEIVYAVHAETSTGVLNDVASLGALKGEWLYVVDCVTSLGGVPFHMDEWGIDVAYSATQKCLSVPPGLAPIAVSERARERILERPRSWYMDLRLIADYAEPGSPRRYHHTAPTSMIRALRAGLSVIFKEGLDEVYARHEAAHRALIKGLAEIGLEPLVEEPHRAIPLTSIRVPESLTGQGEASLRGRLLSEFGIEIGGGLGELTGRIWRVGLMGHGARLENVDRLLDALSTLLKEA